MRGKPPKGKDKPAKKKLPVLKYQDGQVKITVWANKGEYGTMYSAVLKRAYKDADDEWQETDNLDFRDLLPAALALQNVHSMIVDIKGQGFVDPAGKKDKGDDGDESGDDESGDESGDD